MRDIETREDILLLMEKFYNKLLADPSIHHFFIQTTNVSQHLPEHFELLTTFWEQALFLRGGYFRFNTKYINPFPVPSLPHNISKYNEKAEEILEEELLLNPTNAYVNKEYIYTISKTEGTEDFL